MDTIRPDPIDRELELAPDIQSLIEEQKFSEDEIGVAKKAAPVSDQEVTQDVVDEDQFAGSRDAENPNLRTLRIQQQTKRRRRRTFKGSGS